MTIDRDLPAERADPPTLVDLLERHASIHPDRRAFTFLENGEQESQVWTYRELNGRARALASQLQQVCEPGERALLLFKSSLDFIAAFFGCLYTGVVAVPAYPPRRNRFDQRLHAIVEDAQPTVALSTSDVLAERERRLTHNPELETLRWLAADRPDLEVGEGWTRQAIDRDTLAFLQYTSGSTATPKGVMVSHGNLIRNLDDLGTGLGFSADGVMVSWLPTFHDLGLVFGVLQPIYDGGCGVLMPPASFLQRPARWLEALSRYKGTHSAAPNFAYDLCVKTVTAEQRAALDLTSWRGSINAAETVREETLRQFFHAFEPCGLQPTTVCPGYGLAEITLKVSCKRWHSPSSACRVRVDELANHRVVEAGPLDAESVAIVSCGQSEVDTQVVIVDPERRIRMTADDVGEIWVAGESVARGYWRRPEETKATFQAVLADDWTERFFVPEISASVRDGEVFVTGRIKDLIILRGLNYYPTDIEQTVEKASAGLRASSGAAFSIESSGEECLVVVQEIERTVRPQG